MWSSVVLPIPLPAPILAPKSLGDLIRTVERVPRRAVPNGCFAQFLKSGGRNENGCPVRNQDWLRGMFGITATRRCPAVGPQCPQEQEKFERLDKKWL